MAARVGKNKPQIWKASKVRHRVELNPATTAFWRESERDYL
jgi:hypothetical protein